MVFDQTFDADGAAKIGQFSGHTAFVSHGSDRGLAAEFFIVDEYQPFQSALEGRAIYKQIEMIRMSVPGGKTDIIKQVTFQDSPDGPAHVNRFPEQYRRFKAQQEQVPNGTPLEMCKFIASHRVKELKAQNVHTAEQYSTLPDSIVQTLGMGAFKERELCVTYLGNDDEKTKRVSRALAENDALRGELEAMKQQMADLNRAMGEKMAARGQITQQTLAENFPDPLPGEIFEEAPLPTVKRGPGRPRKDEAA
jgi:hypothetical protein